jgi:hypothetical protein
LTGSACFTGRPDNAFPLAPAQPFFDHRSIAIS